MPRTPGDHDSRRRHVADAVLRVLAAHGFAGLTMRAVAAELGASTGVLTHYFAGKRELVNFALELLGRSVTDRPRQTNGTGLTALRTALLGMLPLTPDTATANRIWVSSWDAVLSDSRLTAGYAQLYAESRARLERAIRDAQVLGQLELSEPKQLAAAIHAFALGLIVQAVLDPEEFPPDRVVAMTDTYLNSLARGDDVAGVRNAQVVRTEASQCQPNRPSGEEVGDGTFLGTDLRR